MTNELAFAIATFQFEFLLVAIAIDFVSSTRLDAGQHADESLLNVVFDRDVPSELVFTNFWRVQIFDGPIRLLSRFDRGSDQLSCPLLSMLAEMFQQDTDVGEISHHSIDEAEHPQGAAKDESIPSTELAGDTVVEFLYKEIHGILALVEKEE